MIVYLTQRTDKFESYGETRDSLDQRWVATIHAIFGRSVVVPVSNSPENVGALLEEVEPDVIVLTGGNDVYRGDTGELEAPERYSTERGLLEHAERNNTRVLGVCRGFQLMNVYSGGRLKGCRGHVAVDHPVYTEDGEQAFVVNSFHNYCIPVDGLAGDISPLYFDKDRRIEAGRHVSRRWVGVMWHPERPAPDKAGEIRMLREHLLG